VVDPISATTLFQSINSVSHFKVKITKIYADDPFGLNIAKYIKLLNEAYDPPAESNGSNCYDQFKNKHPKPPKYIRPKKGLNPKFL